MRAPNVVGGHSPTASGAVTYARKSASMPPITPIAAPLPKCAAAFLFAATAVVPASLALSFALSMFAVSRLLSFANGGLRLKANPAMLSR